MRIEKEPRRVPFSILNSSILNPAERNEAGPGEPGGDRTYERLVKSQLLYNVVVVCSDASGNEVGDSARMVVPVQPARTDHPPVIVKLAASANLLSPRNNEWCW